MIINNDLIFFLETKKFVGRATNPRGEFFQIFDD